MDASTQEDKQNFHIINASMLFRHNTGNLIL